MHPRCSVEIDRGVSIAVGAGLLRRAGPTAKRRRQSPQWLAQVGRVGEGPPERDPDGSDGVKVRQEMSAVEAAHLGPASGLDLEPGPVWRRELAEGEELGSNCLRLAARSW